MMVSAVHGANRIRAKAMRDPAWNFCSLHLMFVEEDGSHASLDVFFPQDRFDYIGAVAEAINKVGGDGDAEQEEVLPEPNRGVIGALLDIARTGGRRPIR